MTPESPPPVLRLRGLTFAYPGEPPLFDGASFTLPAGLTRLDLERGKTTWLQLLAGARRPTAPLQAALNGAPWQPADRPAAACLVDPRDPAWDALTPAAVRDAVQARHPTLDQSAWQRLVDAFELGPHLGKTMHMLSTGSRRKVALAAALAAGAPLTLLDEPDAGLDRPALDALVRALHDAVAADVGRRRAWVLAAAWSLEARLPWAAVIEAPDGT